MVSAKLDHSDTESQGICKLLTNKGLLKAPGVV